MQEDRSRLVEQVLSGGNPELQKLAAEGVLPLPPEQLIALQIRLARKGGAVGRTATESLRATESRLLIDYINREADVEALAFFTAEITHPVVLEALLRRRDIPRNLLFEIAPRLEPALQEILILRQDAIVEAPAILDSLEANPNLEASVERRIGEYREHLLPRKAAPRPAAPEPEEDADDEELASDSEVKAAIEKAAEAPAEGERDEHTGLTDGQIRLLPVPVRLKLSRGASRSLRAILVRDTNSHVAVSCLQNNAFSDDEVEGVARSRQVVDDVLTEISRRREWMTKYNIVHALVSNPRTPVAIALKNIPRLSIRDLRNLSRSRNVSRAVRTRAQNMLATKTG